MFGRLLIGRGSEDGFQGRLQPTTAGKGDDAGAAYAEEEDRECHISSGILPELRGVSGLQRTHSLRISEHSRRQSKNAKISLLNWIEGLSQEPLGLCSDNDHGRKLGRHHEGGGAGGLPVVPSNDF